MTLTPYISPNVFLHIPPSLSRKRRRTRKSQAGPVSLDAESEGLDHSTGTGSQTSSISNSTSTPIVSTSSTADPNGFKSGSERTTRPIRSNQSKDGRPPRQRRQRLQVTLVFFITGNPGLVSYYHPFLSLLVENLGQRNGDADADRIKARGDFVGREHGTGRRQGRDNEQHLSLKQSGEEQQRSQKRKETDDGKQSSDYGCDTDHGFDDLDDDHIVVVAGFSLGGFDVDVNIDADAGVQDNVKGSPWTKQKKGPMTGRSGVEKSENDRSENNGRWGAEGMTRGGLGTVRDDFQAHDRTDEVGGNMTDADESEDDHEDEDEDTQIRNLLYPPLPRQSGNGDRLADDRGSDDNDNSDIDDDDKNKLYSLREQIELSYARVESQPPTEPIKVIFIGHSVGAYIALEIMRLWHERHSHSHTHTQSGETESTGRSRSRSGNDLSKDAGSSSCADLLSSSSSSSSSAHVPAAAAATTTPIPTPASSTSTPRTPGPAPAPSPSIPTRPQSPSVPPSWTISGSFLLTPTIMDIHRSTSGRFATPLLTSLSHSHSLPSPLPRSLQLNPQFLLLSLSQTLLHSVLVNRLPAKWLSWLVARVTGMKPGSHGLEATLAFLRSPRGVKQALYMAADEMREIRADKWGEEIWGVGVAEATTTKAEASSSSSSSKQPPTPSTGASIPPPPTTETESRSMSDIPNHVQDSERHTPHPKFRPMLYFWFAKSDHWVADITREEIQKTRGRGVVERDEIDIDAFNTKADMTHLASDGPQDPKDEKTMVVEEEASLVRIFETDGLAHAWCLDQTEFVARRVSGWVREILDRDARASH
ncbi:hypothetical protein A1O1_04444 [Capronia coronata CBS 617.96]|uniref:Uncharacterized protein n=1 Tax=Capronia coronata CBS 617.96 TaxID=1182541 RepID=W9YEQ9_9EURO|nr:uncharacterized protein A1O1_04444 [Capronia coronata CBS 617.96]EXJ91332.1 hypothetical protein A1O1_04444 [Capronia coronata CBS 617.96]